MFHCNITIVSSLILTYIVGQENTIAPFDLIVNLIIYRWYELVHPCAFFRIDPVKSKQTVSE